MLATKISHKIEDVIDTTKELSNGNLAVKIDVPEKIKDEVENLLKYIKHLIVSFNHLISDIKSGSLETEIGSIKLGKVKSFLANSLNSTSHEINQTVTILQELIASIKEENQEMGTIKEHTELISKDASEMYSGIEMVSSLIQEVGALAVETAEAIASMLESIENIAIQISEADNNMEEVRNAGIDVKNKIQNTVNEAEVIAAEMETVSSAVNEQSASIENVAENAEKAEELSENTLKKAEEGVETLKILLKSINEIKERVFNVGKDINELSGMAENIGKITDTIDEISEQTNLLALNAAIEAARAGEAGKGFAVVADEIRKLAERSSLAAKDIANLIKDIQEKVINATKVTETSIKVVEKGTELADKTSMVVQDIYEASENTKNFVLQISNATSEQAEVSSQIVQSVLNVKEKSDEILNISRELESAGELILDKVDQMKNMIAEINNQAQEQKTTGENIANAVKNMQESANKTDSTMQEQKVMVQRVVDSIKESEDLISQVVKKIQYQASATETIEETSNNLIKINNENTENLREVGNVQMLIKELSADLINKINAFKLDDLSELKSAEAKHNVYLETIYSLMQTENNIPESNIKDADTCEFGKWFLAVKNKYSHVSNINQLEIAHKNFHNKIKEAIQLFNNNEKDKSLEILDEAKNILNSEIKGYLNTFISELEKKEANIELVE